MYGSEVVAKDVLEYVVFEKHIANTYGLWRIHEKIVPDWMPPREPGKRTYFKPIDPPPVVSTPATTEKTTTQENATPALA